MQQSTAYADIGPVSAGFGYYEAVGGSPYARGMPSWLEHSPATYSAWIAGVAVVATLTAAVIAYRQLRLARETRLKQAQPSVVTFETHSAASVEIIELVIKNFGPTPAYDVRLASEPTMRRTGSNAAVVEDVWVPAVVPMLAPGQEWRTVWDFAPDRFANGTLDKRHEVVLSYSDWLGNPLSSRSILDWAAYDGRHYAQTFTVHNVTKVLRDIDNHLTEWSRAIARDGVDAWVRDGNVKDARNAEAKVVRGQAEALYFQTMRQTGQPPES